MRVELLIIEEQNQSIANEMTQPGLSADKF